jgi:hypothetical protein
MLHFLGVTGQDSWFYRRTDSRLGALPDDIETLKAALVAEAARRRHGDTATGAPTSPKNSAGSVAPPEKISRNFGTPTMRDKLRSSVEGFFLSRQCFVADYLRICGDCARAGPGAVLTRSRNLELSLGILAPLGVLC